MRKSQYSSKKRTPQKSSLKRIIFTGLFFCLLTGSVYSLIFWPGLWIDKVEVNSLTPPLKDNLRSGIMEIVQKDLEEKLWQFIPQRSIIFAPLNKIQKDILDKFPQIKIIEIKRKMPQLAALKSLTQTAEAGLEILVKERKRIGIWCQVEEIVDEERLTEEAKETNFKEDEETEEIKKDEEARKKEKVSQTKIKDCFYLDEEGIIFQESPLISGSLILNIYSSKDEQVKLRQQVLSPETIDFILILKEELPKIKTAAGLSWQLNNFRVISPEDLRVKMSTGWQIYFNPAYAAESQLKALEMVLEKQIEETASLEYVDLRIENRVYYR